MSGKSNWPASYFQYILEVVDLDRQLKRIKFQTVDQEISSISSF